MLDLTEVRFVKRIVVGSDNPSRMQTREEIAAAEALVNRCLSDSPRGSLLALEKSFTVIHVGEHQVVLQWLVYHIGFIRRPLWLVD